MSRFTKGFTPWNKGTKGICKPNSSSFKKGFTPWNAGITGYVGANKGRKFPQCMGSNHHAWNNGIKIGDYVRLYAPHHPRTYRNYVSKHVLVAEKHLDRFLTPYEEVHHIDFDKYNNNPENLFVFENKSEHKSFHMYYRYHPMLNGFLKSNII